MGLDGGKFSSGLSIITNPTIITEITNPANWDDDGNYTGSTTGLVTGNVYYDSANKLRYEYNGTTVTRINYNTQV